MPERKLIMEENLIQQESEVLEPEKSEPENSDNSAAFSQNNTDSKTQINDGESVKDPSENLILGKFKSVKDLSKAYEELQKHQGQCSAELGSLRQELASMNEFRQNLDKVNDIQNKMMPAIKEAKEKYNTPEYLQDPTFREIYREALFALGENLDTDRLVNLLESYVSARIFAHDQKAKANQETQQVLDSMSYSKNPKSSLDKPKKTLDEMTEAEVDEMLDRLL